MRGSGEPRDGSSLLPVYVSLTPLSLPFCPHHVFQPKRPQVVWHLSGFPEALQAVAAVWVFIPMVGPEGQSLSRDTQTVAVWAEIPLSS